MGRWREQFSVPLIVVLFAGGYLFAGGCHQIATPPEDGALAPASAPAPAPAASAPTHDAVELQAVYLANEGFFVRSGERAVLIDALFSDGVLGYEVMTPPAREALETGASPSPPAQVALATHFHPDHFDPGAAARFLAANPEAVFVSTPQAAASFARANPDRADLLRRFHEVLPAPGTVETLEFQGIEIQVLNLHHGRREPPVENLGFIVDFGHERFIHFGDTEAKMEDFEPYLEQLAEPDLALLPFWFLTSEWRAEMVRDLIRPQAIAAGHLPRPDAPPGHFARWGSYGALRATLEEAFPDAWIPSASGEAMPSRSPKSPATEH